MNLQVLADSSRLLWASPGLPGATHGLTATCEHGIIDVLAAAGLTAYADKTYQGAGHSVRVPFRKTVASSDGSADTTPPQPRSASPANRPWQS